MTSLAPITCLEDYAKALVRPLSVLVVDTQTTSFKMIAGALASYNAKVYNASCGCEAAVCLQKLAPFDLAFVGVPLKTYGTPADIMDEIQRVSPEATVVIMAETLDASVEKLLERGPCTFLKKNGTFDEGHIRQVASHLKLKLRPNGKAGATQNVIPEATT